jgi:hypothetical protein
MRRIVPARATLREQDRGGADDQKTDRCEEEAARDPHGARW